nr:hypothetical protein CcurKRNrm2_p044 [Cryptomonas curvata]
MIKKKSFLFILLILLNKKLYFFRKKRNFFFHRLNMFGNYIQNYKLLDSKTKIKYMLFKIRLKIKYNIKKFVDFNKIYCLFFTASMKNINLFVNQSSERILIFNLITKYYKKIWYYQYNLNKKFLQFKIKKKFLGKLINNFAWAEKKFLNFKKKEKNFLTNEDIFLKNFFLTNYKVSLKLNTNLNRKDKKDLNSKICFEKKKVVYLIHQKLIGFAPKILVKHDIFKHNFNLFRKIVENSG